MHFLIDFIVRCAQSFPASIGTNGAGFFLQAVWWFVVTEASAYWVIWLAVTLNKLERDRMTSHLSNLKIGVVVWVLGLVFGYGSFFILHMLNVRSQIIADAELAVPNVPLAQFQKPLIQRSVPKPLPQSPFSATVLSMWGASDNTDKASTTWMAYHCIVGTINGMCRAPLSTLIAVRVINLQSTAVQISQLTYEVKTPTGWLRVEPVDVATNRYYQVDSNNFTAAIELHLQTLQFMLNDRAIGAKETVSGYVAIVYPRLIPPSNILTKEWRITIGDTLGHCSVVETKDVKPGNFGHNDIIVLPGRQDISQYTQQYIQLISSYWIDRGNSQCNANDKN